MSESSCLFLVLVRKKSKEKFWVARAVVLGLPAPSLPLLTSF